VENKSGATLDVAAEKNAARRDRGKTAARGLRQGRRQGEDGEGRHRHRDNTHIQVKTGVKTGDEIVSGSYAAISRKLKDDMKVQIEKPKKEEDKK